MHRALIHWEIIGWGYKVWELAFTAEQLSKVLKCHGHYINGDDWPPECEWLAEFLEDYPPIVESEDVGTTSSPYFPAHKIDAVIFTGMHL